MGCCAACEASSSEPNAMLSVAPITLSQLSILRFDPFAMDIQQYFHELLQTAAWTANTELPSVTIKSLPTSRYSEKAPVMCLQLAPFQATDPAYIVQLLTDPKLRMSWDEMLGDCHELQSSSRTVYYSLFQFPFPFKDRDFIETAVILPSNSGLTLVKYSTEECEVQSQAERGTTHFFVARVKVREGLTEVTVMAQMDLSLPFKQQILMRYASLLVKDWVEEFIKKAQDGRKELSASMN